jgi:hypothetical protein
MATQIIDFDDDFGFTAVSDEEFKQREINAAKKAMLTVEDKVEQQKRINQNIRDAIIPLLQNLMKDADEKEYIYWPNRKEKIQLFIQKLNRIASGE